MKVSEKLALLKAKREKAAAMGGRERVEKQHEKGKLTARERIEMLFDEGTFRELDTFVSHRSVNFGMEKVEI
ncbi:MAG TPA: methylmalonyl-CoA carboxyltransferase, partial [Bacteroidales bacterium]|nr:methylmalonyl-CoA carboxyltransferase [Bacteroidales bacterium]